MNRFHTKTSKIQEGWVIFRNKSSREIRIGKNHYCSNLNYMSIKYINNVFEWRTSSKNSKIYGKSEFSQSQLCQTNWNLLQAFFPLVAQTSPGQRPISEQPTDLSFHPLLNDSFQLCNKLASPKFCFPLMSQCYSSKFAPQVISLCCGPLWILDMCLNQL